jgi:malonyl-CoA/methylmalonyl-CoA synthetase
MTRLAVPDLIARAQGHGARIAIFDLHGSYSYDDLLNASARIAATLLNARDDLHEERVAFLITPGFLWVAVQWGIWRAGGIAVPLPLGSPWAELEYCLEDTQASAVIFDADNQQLLASVKAAAKARVLVFKQLPESSPGAMPLVSNSRRAMILYTSGTTSRPKGVVTTHASIAAQISSLVEAWEWTAQDRILLCLPLHHVHGIINALSCALWSGAGCEMLPRFDAEVVWQRIASGELTLFMAVPTIYAKLIAAWETSPECRAAWSAGAAKLRLMVSGSAALPVSTLERWREITGHTLLERYGMTEIGMALSNSYRGARVPCSVGLPLAGVAVRLVNEGGDEVPFGTPGETEVQGASVFQEYWGKPDATREAFRDGWFRTGDTAVVENSVYRILGRSNVDIIKTGGHKVSALEIEEVLREHAAIVECAVVGVRDEEWGERVAAAIVLREGNSVSVEDLRAWAKERLATPKIPSRIAVVESLPRNAMGKVTKSAVRELFSVADTAHN